MKLTKLYTRTGDDGETSLIGGTRVAKTDSRIEAYGTVDELSSHIGLLISFMQERHGNADCPASDSDETAPSDVLQTMADLEKIQCTLFTLSSFLAIDQSTTPLYPSCRVAEESVAWLEQRIDAVQATSGPLQGFVIPGGSVSASQAHVCRTVCRRAERRMTAIAHSEGEEGWQEVMQYINRLSDYLFALSRLINQFDNTEEKIWKK